MTPKLFNTAAHLLICTDPSCKTHGAEYLFDALINAFERQGLAYYKTGGSLRLTTSSCLGACDYEPNMVCYFKHNNATQDSALREAWFHGVGFEMAMQIAEALHLGEEIPERKRFG